MCQGGNNAFWTAGWNSVLFSLHISLLSCCLMTAVLHDGLQAFRSYRTAILAALGELQSVHGEFIVNFTLFGCRDGLYQGIVPQT